MRPPLTVELLEDRITPVFLEGTTFVTVSLPRLVVGAGVSGSEVRVFNAALSGDSNANAQLLRLAPFGADFNGGVNVATADVNGDTFPDIVAGMASGGSQVKVLDGKTGAELTRFTAFDPAFTGGVNVAIGQVAADGGWGIVVGVEGQGGPHVKVFDAQSGVCEQSFFAFEPEFLGGLTVAAGDVTYDGRADVVIGAGKGGGPRVEVFDGRTHDVVRNFFAYAPDFTGGVNVAVTSLYEPASIVVGSDAPGQRIRYIGPDSLSESHETPFVGTGSRVAVASFGGEGSGFDTWPYRQIIAAAGPDGGPHVKQISHFADWEESRSFFAFDSHVTGGVSVAAASFVMNSQFGIAPPQPVDTFSPPGDSDPTLSPGDSV